MDQILFVAAGWRGLGGNSALTTAGCSDEDTDDYSNFKLDKKCIKATSSKTNSGSMVRVRHLRTTPTIWKEQVDSFAASAASSQTLRTVMMVRDPLDIVLSAYFYDASGGEPDPMKIPSDRIPPALNVSCATPGLDELCTALRGFDASTTSWTQVLQRLPPRIGVLAQAVFENGRNQHEGLESLAEAAKAIKGTSSQAKLVDLDAVMADFDGEIERMFRFLGADDPKKCVSACRPVNTVQSAADLDTCLKNSGGNHFKEVEKLRKQLAKSSMLDDKKWFGSYVVGIDKATPEACMPSMSSKHSFNTALEPLKKSLKNVLHGPAPTRVIGPARKSMGYH